jgi:streptogramin lyase
MSLPRRAPLVAVALLLAAAAALTLVALALPVRSGAQGAYPPVIMLPNGWQPEGIAAGPGNILYVGSIPTGRVQRIDPRTGDQRTVVPQREGRAAIGLKARDGLLYVAGGPTGRAFVYDARTGADVRTVPLTTSSTTFVNDVVLARGAAWFTDSRQPQLYRLGLGRRGRPAAAARTVPLSGDLQYDAEPQTTDVNGIVAANRGRTLLVIQSRTSSLFRVDAATGASRRVTITGGDGQELVNGDGLLREGRTLYVVQNRSNRIAVVRLSPSLASGRILRYITDTDFAVPTTVARKRQFLYAPNARFGTTPGPATTYGVVRVREPR